MRLGISSIACSRLMPASFAAASAAWKPSPLQLECLQTKSPAASHTRLPCLQTQLVAQQQAALQREQEIVDAKAQLATANASADKMAAHIESLEVGGDAVSLALIAARSLQSRWAAAMAVVVETRQHTSSRWR